MEKKPANTERLFAFQIATYLFHDMLMQMLDNVMNLQLDDYRSGRVESVPSTYADYFIRRACAYRIIVELSKVVPWTNLTGATQLSAKRIEEVYRHYQTQLPSPEKRITMRNQYIDGVILGYKRNLKEEEAKEYLLNPPADEVELADAILTTEDWGYMFEEERNRVFSIINNLSDTLIADFSSKLEICKELLSNSQSKQHTSTKAYKTPWISKQPATSKARKFILHCIEISILQENRDSNGDIIGYCPTKACTKTEFDKAMSLVGITKRAVFETKQICNTNGKAFSSYNDFYRKYLWRKKN